MLERIETVSFVPNFAIMVIKLAWNVKMCIILTAIYKRKIIRTKMIKIITTINSIFIVLEYNHVAQTVNLTAKNIVSCCIKKFKNKNR